MSLRKGRINLLERRLFRKGYRAGPKVPLQPRIDDKRPRGRIHASHILGVPNILDRDFIPVVPMVVIQVSRKDVVDHEGYLLDNDKTCQKIG